VGHVDVPVVAAAVDVDVADHALGGAGDVLAGDVEDAQDGLGGVPVLAEGGLGAADGLARQPPVAGEPGGGAYHDHDAVPAVGRGQVARQLVGQVQRGADDVVLGDLDLLLGGGGGVACGGGLDGGGLAAELAADLGEVGGQGRDQVVLAHAVPAGDALVAGPVGEGLAGVGGQLVARPNTGAAGPARPGT